MRAALARAPRAAPSTDPTLLGFIPRVSPRYVPPRHLGPLIERLEAAARGEPQRLVVHTPPRHGKTETLLHFIAWMLAQHPDQTLAYVGYAAEFARSKSRKARQFAKAAGVQLADDAARLEEWRTTQGGGLLATGVGGPLTGHGANVLLVDDPIKNRVEAESATWRERTWEWFNDVAFTRLEPGGSAIVVHTRWHTDDLAGRLLAHGWEGLSLKALDDDSRALWPERFSPEKLAEIRTQVGEYTWASLYQGEPRPRGGAVFGDVHFFAPPAPDGVRLAIGVDLAYTAKTSADYSVAVVLAAKDGRFYVVDVVRLQVTAPDFAGELKRLQARYPGVRTRAYIGGTEKGVIDLLNRDGCRIDARPAQGDKFVRAQPVAAAWNAGNVLVAQGARWADPFVTELASFTGVNDPHDDQVDAFAAAFDELSAGGSWFAGIPKGSLGSRRM